MSWFNWLGRSGLPVVSFQDQCRTILKKGGLPCFSVRWTKDQLDDYFVVQFVNDDGSYNGTTLSDLHSPGVGQRVLREEYVDRLGLVDIDSVLTKNGADSQQLWANIHTLARTLPYDVKVCVLTLADGQPVWVKGAFNINDAGFSAECVYDHPKSTSGVKAVFISWELIPYYVGTFHHKYTEERIEDFTYHGWMGNRVTEEAKAKHTQGILDTIKHNLGVAHTKPTLLQRLEKNIENRRLLDKELAELIQLMKKPNVHE